MTANLNYWSLLKIKINGKRKKGFLPAKIDVLNENQLILENEREDKSKRESIQIEQPSTLTNTETIFQAMSLVSLRDKEIMGLKSQN